MPKRRAVLLKIPMASDDVRSRLCDQEIFVFAQNVYAKFLSLRAQPVYGIKNGHDFKAYSVDALLQYVMVNLSKFFFRDPLDSADLLANRVPEDQW